MLIRGTTVLLLLLIAACQSPPDLSQLQKRPEDFTLAATVHALQWSRTIPRPLRPARFILEADSVLRWSPGPTERGVPPPIRHLSPADNDDVWRLALASGLLEPDSPFRVYGPTEADPVESGAPIAIIEIAFAGQQTRSRVPLDRSSDEAVLAERLIGRLAELAFIRE
jgi:hypothetical protein